MRSQRTTAFVRQRWGLSPEQRQLVLGWQRALQSGPLTGDPRTNQTDRGNNGNDQNSQQNGVFDESGTILVFAQLANKFKAFNMRRPFGSCFNELRHVRNLFFTPRLNT